MTHQYTILVVDDEPDMVDSIKDLLRLKHRVLGATSAAQGMKILAEQEVHVVMADQRMPGMTGVEFLHRVRAKHPSAIRLLFTGYSDLRAVIAAINQGSVFRYIAKPWDPDDLMSVIRDAIGRYDLIVERDRLLREMQHNNQEIERRNDQLQLLVAKRQRAEEAAVAAQQRLDHVLRNSPTVTYLLAIESEEPRPKWVSENFRQLTGYPSAEAQEAPGPDWWLARVHPDDQAQVGSLVHTALAKGRSRVEYRFRHKDGTYLVLRDEMNIVRDSTGRPVEAVGTLLDITEQRRLEEQLRQSQKMEAIGLLAGGVAHDFNNLLTVILGHCELMLSRPQGDPPARRAFELIQKSGQRAANLTRRLLEFSRRQAVVPKVFDLNSVIAEEAKLLHQLMRANTELILLLAPDLPRIFADPGQIELVILNLVVNAQDAMPGNGKIIIETSGVLLTEEYLRMHGEVTAGPYVMLAVSDIGCGMNSETLQHIFEPFFTTKEPGKGTGLGLSTVYGIVKQSQGHIEVYSEPGQGTTFKVYLPQAKDQVMPARQLVAEAPPSRGEEVILLVEDEEAVRNLVCSVLEMHGYTVLTARHGGEALQRCREHHGPIHLVVTDVIMPEVGGGELVQSLQRLHSDIKVLFISGYTNQGLFHTGRIEMGEHFLQKPFSPTALAHKVREVLESVGRPSGAA